eukprot:TRINITY_DN8496_c0_g2_i6.p1 TRINITY_DN8496_c0_g2~~TRINITY_DN8496_c0_g2_i6.p1  ORF type:complete len:205 (-),score=43.32 TRINITY_DN8496_c0_g2_i6:38-652(-)
MKREAGGVVLLSFSKDKSDRLDLSIKHVAAEIVTPESMLDIEESKFAGEPMNDIRLLDFCREGMEIEFTEFKIQEELQRVMNSVEKAASKLKYKRTKCWLRPLRKIIGWESQTCEKLWLRLFPQFWSALTVDQQQLIASLIEPFLARDEFLKQMQGRKFNAVKTVFEAVSICSPLPRVAPEIPCTLRCYPVSYTHLTLPTICSV